MGCGAVDAVAPGPAPAAAAALRVVVVFGAAAFRLEPPHAPTARPARATAANVDRTTESARTERTASHLDFDRAGAWHRGNVSALMSAGLLVQVLVTGLAAGAAYALIGIGFALLHQLTGVIQLAHGDFAGAACFLA